ncbi:MAG: MFS transporter [Bacteroidetes bacterium]|nr:MFS transporter [Bacteroidota bacterium]
MKSGLIISRTVWMLSLVSLFTDMASEMLYPVMPVFLRSIGFSVVMIGLLEGMAEATAGLSKGYFGKLSDLKGERVPFVRWGYTLSAISKPLLAASVFPLWIFLARTIDRLGKGIRTGARDAILSAEATVETKARVFGLHRAMDTAGAFIGPSLAILFLYFYPQRYQLLFLIAFIPGIVAVLFTFLLKEKNVNQAGRTPSSFFSFLKYWNDSSPVYRKLVAGLLFFALINSSDVFLLLKLKDSGLSDINVIGVYIFYNLVYALLAYPAGSLADRWGLKKTLITGLILFALVYAGMSVNGSLWWFGFLFFVYGMYAACTESIAKAWITNISRKEETATAVGTYTALQSVCTLIASASAGWVWYSFGPSALFVVTGAAAFVLAIYFLMVRS